MMSADDWCDLEATGIVIDIATSIEMPDISPLNVMRFYLHGYYDPSSTDECHVETFLKCHSDLQFICRVLCHG